MNYCNPLDSNSTLNMETKPNISNSNVRNNKVKPNKQTILEDRLKNIIEANCNLDGKLDSIQFLIEDLLPLFIEERYKVLEEVREIVKTYKVKSILKFRHELLSKINKLK